MDMVSKKSVTEVFIDKDDRISLVKPGGPNIIGNVEDGKSFEFSSTQQYPSLSNVNKEKDITPDGRKSNFKDITKSLHRPM